MSTQRNVIKKGEYVLKLMLGIAVLIFMVNCGDSKKLQYQFDNISPEISLRLDSLEKKMWQYYAENPDSAEIILNYTLNYLDSINLPQKKFYPYMQLAELYQYRKPDYIKAASCLNKAVTIFIMKPAVFMGNAYIFIDIGNIFLYFDRMDQAITFYKIAYDVATSTTNSHPRALALQNISITYASMEKFDSALCYLKMAVRNIPDTTDITMAQNYLAAAGLYNSYNKPDSAINYANRSLRTLDNFRKTRPEMAGNKMDKLFVGWSIMAGVNHRIIAHCYIIKTNPDSCLKHLKLAMHYAREIGSNEGVAGNYVERSVLAASLSDRAIAKQYADSLIDLSKKIDDQILMRGYADSLFRTFSKSKMPGLAARFKSISRMYYDSHRERKDKVALPENDMILTSVAVEQAINSIQKEQQTNNRLIKVHQYLITFITLSAILLLLSTIIFFRQRNKIQRAYVRQAESISRSIKLEDEILKETKLTAGRVSNLSVQLEARMQIGKPYLNSDFSINDLATLLNTNQTYISNLLNKNYGLNFNDYINQLRVKEFCRLADNDEYRTYTLDQLAEKSGFRTRSTFYSAFGKFIGMPPAAFLKARLKLATAPI
jgi:AraC-like DNA-binding protein